MSRERAADRSVGVPAELGAWIARYSGMEPDAADAAPLDGGVAALDEALRRPGRDREGAHALLAADTLLTRVCEDAAGEVDPEARLLEVLERLGGQGAE